MRAFLHLFAFLSGATAQAALNTSEVSIVKASHSGNGCPQGTVSTSFSADRTTITLGFDSVRPYIGPGTSSLTRSRNCAINLQLNYPSGWNFVFTNVTWHGYFTLSEGIRASFYTSFELRSRDTQVATVPVATLNGTAKAASVLFHEELPVADQLSSSCHPYSSSGLNSETVTVRDRWALTATKTDVYQEEWMEEGAALVQQLKLRWQECKY
ncbi:protein of unknown function (DUF4360) domain containing protein [Naviculisporaceae sp. PSN 640]